MVEPNAAENTAEDPGAPRRSPAAPRAPSLGRMVHWALVVLLVATCVSGYVMRVGALSAHNLLPMDVAMQAMNLHLMTGMITTFVLLLGIAARAAPWPPSPRLRAVGQLGIVAVGALFVVLATGQAAAPLLVRCLGVIMMLVGWVGVLAALDLRARRGPGSTPLVRGLTMAALASVSTGFLSLGAGQLVMPRLPIDFLVVAAVAMAGEPAHGARSSRTHHVAILVLGVSAFVGMEPRVLAPLLILARLVAAGVVAWVAWQVQARRASSRLATWTSRLAVLIFVQAVVLRLLLALVDQPSHVHDTAFVTGTGHLESFVVVLALLGEWLRERAPKPGWRYAAPAGVALAAIGVHVMCWALVVLGSRGMPRNYLEYISQFTGLQVAATAGATLLVLGLGLLTLTDRRPAPAPRVSEVFD